MPEGTWKYQLSLKIENHMLNFRADTIEEFVEGLARLEEHREPISVTIASYSPRKPEQSRPVVATGPRPIVSPGATSSEIGPLQIEGVEVRKAGKDLVPYANPLYIVKWEGGSATTFDTLIGKAAMGFWTQGHPCYITTEPSKKNPKWTNLVRIRVAA